MMWFYIQRKTRTMNKVQEKRPKYSVTPLSNNFKFCQWMLVSHSGGPGLIPGQFMWDFNWTK